MKSSYFYTYNAIFEIKVSPNAKIVYAYLCKCADKTGRCFPSQKLIAEKCSISVTTVKKCIAELENAELIKSSGQVRTDGSRCANVYTVVKNESKKGFFVTYMEVFSDKLSAKAKTVYLYFCRLAGGGLEAYPSHKTTATACGLSLSTVRKAIDELESNNLIKRQAQYRENNGQRANLYTLLFDTDNTTEPDPTRPTDNDNSDTATELKGNNDVESNASNEMACNFESKETSELIHTDIGIIDENPNKGEVCPNAYEDIEASSSSDEDETRSLLFPTSNTPLSFYKAPTPVIQRLTELKAIMNNIQNDLKGLIFRKKKFKTLYNSIYTNTGLSCVKYCLWLPDG